MRTLISEISSDVSKELEKDRKKVANRFLKQGIQLGRLQSKEVFSIRSGDNDYLFIPSEVKEGKRQIICEVIARSNQKGTETQRYYISVQPSFKGFDGNIELFNQRAKKITNLTYRLFNGGQPDPEPSYRFKITSREVVVDDDGNKNLILDGTKGNNVHWYINLVLNKHNFPVTVVSNNLP